MDNNRGESEKEKTGMDPNLSAVRSGDLAPYERGEPPAPLADATAITPGRELPPAELTAIMDRYRHVDPIEAMIPVLQEIQTRYGYLTQKAVEQMSAEMGLSETEIYGVVTFY